MNRPIFEEDALASLRPGPSERDHIHSIAAVIVKKIQGSGLADAMVVGSVARDTWISGDRDLDVFMLFSPSVSREELEENGIRLGREIVEDMGGIPVEKYAEHPYINTIIDGLDVDLVPCYAVDDASSIQSAVDRTPFHTRYIKEHIGGLEDDVLLFKQFAKTGGVYGSDLMTEGFAGYLCEVLVLYAGGFGSLVESVTRWKPGMIIDIEGHRQKDFTDSLIVIDPVDPRRNVAASLSLRRFEEFIDLCRAYIDHPSSAFFAGRSAARITKQELQSAIDDRGTGFYALVFQTPHQIPDIVVPQLRRTIGGISDLLSRNDFVINRAAGYMGDKECILVFELIVDTLPALRCHMGPPAHNQVNAKKFASKYLESPVFSGPYITESGIYAVEIRRKWLNARDLLSSGDIFQARMGKYVEQSMHHGYKICSGAECWNEEFSEFLYEFINCSSPLKRLGTIVQGD
ncbi:CCA-adding protein [Methanomicrobiaceae archaeon CYW5]|uniref:CCA tRNA nucleotidyltransferase n=1 Tax=Methanovulcanius yangii TaxID=1789227 RepID=UPI0029CA3007|nr:CCA tRNA nucleotidyltransferase [Methanovulcanius yangii]MBT8507219.1 CCA-adding protein [Methanovulcanius yangii]